MEGDGQQEHEERGASRDREGDADEDGVEKNPGFEEEALEEELLLCLVCGAAGVAGTAGVGRGGFRV